MKTVTVLLAATLGLTSGPIALAQDAYPSRPVKLIVPYAPGGATDVLARSLAVAFQKATGQPLVIENRAGATGTVGAAACKSAPPDGYTLCMPLSDLMTIVPHVFKSVPYDFDRDFTIVTPVAFLVLAVVVNSSVPVNNLKELAVWSAANKDKANVSTWGVGSAGHLLMAQFNKSMGGDLTNVPYAGTPQMIQSTLAGDTSASLVFYGSVASHIATGKLKPLAIQAQRRSPSMPNVPTMSEAGFDFSASFYYCVLAPSGTPSKIVARAREILGAAAADPEVLKTMSTQGFEPLVEPLQVFGERVQRDRATWGSIVKSLDLVPQ